MLHKNFDIYLAVFGGLAAVALVLLHLNAGPIGVLIGLLLVFLAPGYIISMALFPQSNWSAMERVILTLGISLAISVLGGIILYAINVSLSPEHWAFYYGGFILIFGIIAIIRRSKTYPARRKTDRAPESHTHLRPRPWQMALFGLSALIFIGAMILAQTVAKYYPNTEIVQLWMLPAENTSSPSVQLGIKVNESAPAEYSLWLQRGGYIVQTWPHITVTPGEQWETTVEVNPNMAGTGPLEPYLYRYDQPTMPYRRVLLWLDQLQSK